MKLLDPKTLKQCSFYEGAFLYSTHQKVYLGSRPSRLLVNSFVVTGAFYSTLFNHADDGSIQEVWRNCIMAQLVKEDCRYEDY